MHACVHIYLIPRVSDCKTEVFPVVLIQQIACIYPLPPNSIWSSVPFFPQIQGGNPRQATQIISDRLRDQSEETSHFTQIQI